MGGSVPPSHRRGNIASLDEQAGKPTMLPLYVTDRHDCSYLPGLSARTLFVDPSVPMDGATYQALLAQGFRRSGTHIYRPACSSCRRCIALRIPVQAFVPNRSQRRNRTCNHNQVVLRNRPACFDPEHYALYRSYIQSRHGDTDSSDAVLVPYREFLVAPWGGETRFLELYLDTRLMAVAVTDYLPGCLSAVYTFFDPGRSDRAPGTYAVLCQIEEARRLGLEYLYLGYWVGECPKMSYKEHFRPLEAWLDERWQWYGRGAEISGTGRASAAPHTVQSNR
ncbi:arginyltransferase [Candidatus Thiosymbion oneisti]|uniref:arginyltransferase n=1 Tax=Candidatus Thiosymbion oneisti TaxID=589554 RepID=UPI000A5F9E9D|nr:arginyltransferase [Candidatus Thiosymbion oneisti]